MESAYPHDLGLALTRLDGLLRRTVERVLAAYGSATADDPFRGLYISRGDISRLIDHWEAHPVFALADERSVPVLLDGMGRESRLRRLAETYDLSDPDLWIVLIALAPEIDLRYERLYAFLQDDVSKRRPSVDLVLTLLSTTPAGKLALRARFSATAPLIRHGLVELVPEGADSRQPLPACLLVPDPVIAHHLTGQDGLPAELREWAELLDPAAIPTPEPDDAPLPAPSPLPAHPAAVEGQPLRLYFAGPACSRKKRAALALAADAEAPLLAVDLAAVADLGQDWSGAVLRMAELRGAVLYGEPYQALLGEERAATRRRWAEVVAAYDGTTVTSGVSRRLTEHLGSVQPLVVDFPLPSAPERRAHWSHCLDRAHVPLPAPDVDVLAGRYRLTYDGIEEAVSLAAAQTRRLDGREPGPADMAAAARAQSDPALGELAHVITPVNGWEDLVLPEEARGLLGELCGRVDHRHRVLDDWGFGRRLSLGRGTAALFAGPSGTGKTTAAEVVAAELGLGLYRIDLSGVVSKYIGETEKNLRRIFSAAENANAVLFFDEADALFGRRSEVRDSHDRYANIEIAYLLQRMESYDGVAILATNLRQNMDEAFVRRLQFVVEFPFPDEHQRAAIWNLHFPPQAPRAENLDLPLLARRFRMTGGAIRNAVLAAAYLAAAEDRPIGMGDLLHATAREHAKAGRVLALKDLEPFEEMVRA
ncbi:ATP-binding protein [Streptomyces sp. Tu102]|uniref:ATP-binding protein n=1 Tax=Streptomyces sp. Tu102 TaxID=2838019 RepID=UPI001BDD3CFA|nr:ATP-binding protein [Streptomyces sp. Tu102]MBT1090309.1 ATP-binding protein [Streptomyces sp. Tu102]